jgi:hypothetical protein
VTGRPRSPRPLDAEEFADLVGLADGLKRTQSLAERLCNPDPAVGLPAVYSLRDLADKLEALQVDNARTLGWSWSAIAERLGVTRQSAHDKHAARVRASQKGS